MWKRKDVKAKGKASFKANFWKCVATALILAVIGGGSGSFSSAGSSFSSATRNYKESYEENERDYSSYSSDREALLDSDDGRSFSFTTDDGSEVNVQVKGDELIVDAGNGNVESVDRKEIEGAGAAIVGIVFLIVAVVVIVAMAIGFVFDAFLINPIELGCRRFFRKNLDEPASLSNLMFAFDNHYKNIVKTMFFRDLYIALWSLLFIIPGIIKKYEYKMIPYLLSENPDMTKEEAFAESKKLMTGNKWKAFVLDLSFILWDFASMFTCGLAGIFYVNPYKQSTDAALYEAIKYGTVEAAN